MSPFCADKERDRLISLPHSQIREGFQREPEDRVFAFLLATKTKNPRFCCIVTKIFLQKWLTIQLRRWTIPRIRESSIFFTSKSSRTPPDMSAKATTSHSNSSTSPSRLSEEMFNSEKHPSGNAKVMQCYSSEPVYSPDDQNFSSTIQGKIMDGKTPQQRCFFRSIFSPHKKKWNNRWRQRTGQSSTSALTTSTT